MDMLEHNATTRRDFLRAGSVLGGGLFIGYGAPEEAQAQNAVAADGTARLHYETDAPAAAFSPSAFIRIASDDTVTILVGKSEMGQGVLTGLAQIIADELDADWSRVGVQQSPTHPDYGNPPAGVMQTGGSTSVRAQWTRLRTAGAAARAMLVNAAAQEWGVDAAAVRAQAGVLSSGGRRATYGELAAKASTLPVPQSPKLKDAKDFKLIGQPVKRVDTPSKVNGSARFGINVQVPGMKIAVVAFAPIYGGKPRSVNAAAALRVPGVRQVVTLPMGVGVVADHYWAATQGRAALKIEWDAPDKPYADMSMAQIKQSFVAALAKPGLPAKRTGDGEAALQAAGTRVLTREYEQPYLAHATMEPMNCTVSVSNGRCEIWAPTQGQTGVQNLAAATLGLPSDRVTVHTTFLGGGFGRRLVHDYVPPAVLLAKEAGVPVKLVYSREDDMKAGYYRPFSRVRVSAGIDAQGRVSAITAKVAVASVAKWANFRFLIRPDGVDVQAVEGLIDIPYAIPHQHIEWVNHDIEFPILPWRAVGASHNPFAIETLIDELAAELKQDPVAFRRAMLVGAPRHLAALNLAAEKAGWGEPMPAGVGRGVAVVLCYGTAVAMVVDVRLENGVPRVLRVVAGVDCGTAINPQQIEAQMQGSVVYGLSAFLGQQITIERGVVQQGNFSDVPALRMPAMPQVQVHIVPSIAPPGGIGEPGLPPFGPALANALFQITGKRTTTLPYGT